MTLPSLLTRESEKKWTHRAQVTIHAVFERMEMAVYRDTWKGFQSVRTEQTITRPGDPLRRLPHWSLQMPGGERPLSNKLVNLKGMWRIIKRPCYPCEKSLHEKSNMVFCICYVEKLSCERRYMMLIRWCKTDINSWDCLIIFSSSTMTYLF